MRLKLSMSQSSQTLAHNKFNLVYFYFELQQNAVFIDPNPTQFWPEDFLLHDQFFTIESLR